MTEMSRPYYVQEARSGLRMISTYIEQPNQRRHVTGHEWRDQAAMQAWIAEPPDYEGDGLIFSMPFPDWQTAEAWLHHQAPYTGW